MDSQGNNFSLKVRMPASSRCLFTQEVEKSFPRVSSVRLWKPRKSKEASNNTLDIPGVFPRFLHKISWELFFPLACPDVLIDALVPSRSSPRDYIITCIFNIITYSFTAGPVVAMRI